MNILLLWGLVLLLFTLFVIILTTRVTVIPARRARQIKPICTDSTVGEYKCVCGCAVSVSYQDPDNDEDYFMFNFCPDCGKQMDWDAVDEELDNYINGTAKK